MRTAFSAFIALMITLALFVLMASWVVPQTDSRRYAEWSEEARDREFQREWGRYDAIQQFVDTATACSVDADCTIHAFGCPLDCYSVVARDQVELIEEMKDAVHQETGMGCIYACAGPPEGSQAICVGGECRLGEPQRITFETRDP
ncbi:hypothetical protein [Halomonas denitrificans]|nr:hypothetical protein [Halomonas denitrificans]